jgi:putative spermidine/putrescine transport system ATP-binding protein
MNSNSVGFQPDASPLRRLVELPQSVAPTCKEGGRNRLQGTIEEVSFLGAIVRIRASFKEFAVSLDIFNSPSSPLPERGCRAGEYWCSGLSEP